ncbi:MAG TPA: DUF3667 domain-containing protein [Thermoanaerobaculia bacterium]|nr:DUF3667 domain-containing protein [Thermoanaerobaculia bacterium]
MTVCTNCGVDAADVYCARCGERQPGHHDLSVAHFFHDVVHEFVHLDSKLFRTLRDLVTRPGLATAEHFAGRKSRYIPPLRLFLTLFALQFLAFTFYKPAAIYSVHTMTTLDAGGLLARKIEKKAQKHHITLEEYEHRVDERWHKNYSLLQLVNIAGIALLLKIVYFRRHLVEHLVFAAHFLSFTYLLSLVFAFPIYAIVGVHRGPLRTTVSVINIVVALAYLFLAQRFFYRDSPAATALKTAFVSLGRYAIGGFLIGGSLIAALMMID